MRRTPAATAPSAMIGHEADVAGAPDMGAAAELDRKGLAGVRSPPRLCPSIRRALRRRISRRTARARQTPRLLEAHQPRHDRLVLQNDAIGDVLDLGEFAIADRLGMREIEPQPVGRHHRALLRDVVAEHLAQRLVQQMRRRMVGPNRRERRSWSTSSASARTLRQDAFLDLDLVQEQIAEFLLRVLTRGPDAGRIRTPISPTWPPLSA
jgi:hypothetical protein